MDDVHKLYQEVILKENKTPFHFEKKEAGYQMIEAYNPVCGDQYKLFLKMEQNKLKDLFFHGYGCAISKASTSILAKHSEDKSIGELKSMIELFLKNIAENNVIVDEILQKEFNAFKAAKQFPGRIKCATLSWNTLLKNLAILDNPKSNEFEE